MSCVKDELCTWTRDRRTTLTATACAEYHTPIDVIRRLQEHAPVISFEIQLEVLAHGQGLSGFDGDTMSIFDDISDQHKCGGSTTLVHVRKCLHD